MEDFAVLKTDQFMDKEFLRQVRIIDEVESDNEAAEILRTWYGDNIDVQNVEISPDQTLLRNGRTVLPPEDKFVPGALQ